VTTFVAVVDLAYQQAALCICDRVLLRKEGSPGTQSTTKNATR